MKANTVAPASNSALVVKANPVGPFTGFWIFLDDIGRIEFQVIGTTLGLKSDVRTNNQFDDNNFHHVVITKSTVATASGMTIYVDGVSQTLTTVDDDLSGSMLNNFAVTIGAANSGGIPLTGQIDDVLIFGNELTASQISLLSGL